MKRSNFQRLGGAVLGLIILTAGVALAETVITESAGTITEYNQDALVIRSEVATAPTRYVINRKVEYVDDDGVPIAPEEVRLGVPVTVRYVREADHVLAQRVVVHRRVAAPVPATTVVTPAPAVVERRVVAPVAPAVVEQRVVTPAAPVVVEKRIAPAVVEERTTTTTTTTRRAKGD